MNISKISTVIFIITVGPGILMILESFTVKGEAQGISQLLGSGFLFVGVFAWAIIVAILKITNYFINKN